MADPTLDKTWEFVVNGIALANNDRASTLAHQDRREMLLDIKQSLTNTGSHSGMTAPWTVTSSSDSATAGASDQWTDIDDLVWRDEDSTGNAFSWIVLRQTGISTTFELLLALESDSTFDDGAQIYASVAQAGFTGGNTTTAPTATDERVLRNDDGTSRGYWGSGTDGSVSAPAYRWDVSMSSDGQCTRVLIFMNTICTGFWLFDKPKNPASGWTDPYVAGIIATNSFTIEMPKYANLLDGTGAGLQMGGRFSGVDTTILLSSEGYLNSAIGELLPVPNQLDDSFIASEIGVRSQTATFTGAMGELFDIWWGFIWAGTGRYFPVGGTRLYVQVAHMIFPWDGASDIKIR